MYYIYKHTLNNKSYIGYTSKTIEERLNEHIANAERGRLYHFQCAIRKYGKENIVTECLEVIDTNDKTLASEREKYWIAYYDTVNNGYNMTEGGTGGNTWRNNPNKEETSRKLSAVWAGRKHTEESKKIMSEKAKNRPPMPKEAIKRAEEKRKLLRATGDYFSKEGMEKLREVGRNKVFNEAYRKKLSDSAKTRPQVQCPHCGKTGVRNSMIRWHFDNCKERK